MNVCICHACYIKHFEISLAYWSNLKQITRCNVLWIYIMRVIYNILKFHYHIDQIWSKFKDITFLWIYHDCRMKRFDVLLTLQWDTAIMIGEVWNRFENKIIKVPIFYVYINNSNGQLSIILFHTTNIKYLQIFNGTIFNTQYY